MPSAEGNADASLGASRYTAGMSEQELKRRIARARYGGNTRARPLDGTAAEPLRMWSVSEFADIQECHQAALDAITDDWSVPRHLPSAQELSEPLPLRPWLEEPFTPKPKRRARS